MIYRVILKVSYLDVFFDFNSSVDAVNFANTCVKKNVKSDDVKKSVGVTIQIIDKDKESEEEE